MTNIANTNPMSPTQFASIALIAALLSLLLVNQTFIDNFFFVFFAPNLFGDPENYIQAIGFEPILITSKDISLPLT